MAKSQRRVPPSLGPIALLVVVFAWIFAPVLSGRATFVHGDALSVSLPLQELLASGLAEGRLPQWSPDIYGGHPIFAEGQGGFLHPVNLLLFGGLAPLIDDPGDTVGAGTLYAHGLLHVICAWMAAIGSFALCRALGLGRPASLFGALALAASADWLGMTGNAAIALTTSFAPLAAWAAERWWREPSPGRAGVLGACVAAMGLGGYPQAVHALAIALLVTFGLRADRGFWRAPGRHLVTATLAVVVAFALAAVQLLPTLELAGLSVRAGGVELAYAGSPLRQLRGLLHAGGPLGVVEPGLGSPLVLLLAGLGIAASRVRLGWLLAALVLFQLGIADRSPLYRALHGWLPGLGLFRITHLYASVGLLGVAVLAAFGVQRLAGLGAAGEDRRRIALQGALVVSVLVALGWSARHAELGSLGYGFAAVAAVGIALLAWRRRARWLPVGLVLLLLAEIAVLRAPLHDFVDARVAGEPPPTAAFLRERHAEALRTGAPLDFRMAHVPHFFSYIGFAPPSTPKLDDLARLYLSSMDAGSNLLWGLPSINANLALPLQRRARVDALIEDELSGDSPRAVGLRFVDGQSVRYVVARERQRPTPYADDLQRLFFDPGSRFFVLENSAARSRLQLVAPAETRWVPDLEAALAAFREPGRARAILEGDPPSAVAAAGDPAARILSLEARDERYRVTVDARAPVHLVLADAPHPGWRARLDGSAVAITPANVLSKAVSVPAGRHEVELEFAPASFRVGAWITTGAAVALAGWGLVARRRRGAG